MAKTCMVLGGNFFINDFKITAENALGIYTGTNCQKGVTIFICSDLDQATDFVL